MFCIKPINSGGFTSPAALTAAPKIMETPKVGENKINTFK